MIVLELVAKDLEAAKDLAELSVEDLVELAVEDLAELAAEHNMHF